MLKNQSVNKSKCLKAVDMVSKSERTGNETDAL